MSNQPYTNCITSSYHISEFGFITRSSLKNVTYRLVPFPPWSPWVGYDCVLVNWGKLFKQFRHLFHSNRYSLDMLPELLHTLYVAKIFRIRPQHLRISIRISGRWCFYLRAYWGPIALKYPQKDRLS